MNVLRQIPACWRLSFRRNSYPERKRNPLSAPNPPDDPDPCQQQMTNQATSQYGGVSETDTWQPWSTGTSFDSGRTVRGLVSKAPSRSETAPGPNVGTDLLQGLPPARLRPPRGAATGWSISRPAWTQTPLHTDYFLRGICTDRSRKRRVGAEAPPDVSSSLPSAITRRR